MRMTRKRGAEKKLHFLAASDGLDWHRLGSVAWWEKVFCVQWCLMVSDCVRVRSRRGVDVRAARQRRPCRADGFWSGLVRITLDYSGSRGGKSLKPLFGFIWLYLA